MARKAKGKGKREFGPVAPGQVNWRPEGEQDTPLPVEEVTDFRGFASSSSLMSSATPATLASPISPPTPVASSTTVPQSNSALYASVVSSNLAQNPVAVPITSPSEAALSLEPSASSASSNNAKTPSTKASPIPPQAPTSSKPSARLASSNQPNPQLSMASSIPHRTPVASSSKTESPSLPTSAKKSLTEIRKGLRDQGRDTIIGVGGTLMPVVHPCNSSFFFFANDIQW
jgi:hypothetical protein